MRDDIEKTQEPIPPTAASSSTGYVAPSIVRLGTLAELTRGGTVGPDDGLGGAGDDGSL